MNRLPLFLIVLGLGWLVWFLLLASSKNNRATEYQSAPVCPEGKPAQTCKQRVPAVVADKRKESGYRSKTYELTVRALDADVLDVQVYGGTYDQSEIGDAVEVERWNKKVTKLFKNGKEVKLPARIRSFSSAKKWVPFGILASLSGWAIVSSLRNRKRKTKAI